MKTGTQIGLMFAALMLGTVCAHGVDTIALPRLPAMGPKSATVISQVEIRRQLRAFLPKSELVLTETRAQAGRVGDDADALGEPQTVAARIGIHPVIDLADANYSVVPYEYLPVLVDWFEELARSMGYELRETRAAGFRTNKVARLMRVFLSSHLRGTGQNRPGVVPAIGWCRVLLQEDWGRCRKGETHTFVLVATERGWFLVDPYERLHKRVDTKDHRWVVEFVVL